MLRAGISHAQRNDPSPAVGRQHGLAGRDLQGGAAPRPPLEEARPTLGAPSPPHAALLGRQDGGSRGRRSPAAPAPGPPPPPPPPDARAGAARRSESAPPGGPQGGRGSLAGGSQGAPHCSGESPLPLPSPAKGGVCKPRSRVGGEPLPKGVWGGGGLERVKESSPTDPLNNVLRAYVELGGLWGADSIRGAGGALRVCPLQSMLSAWRDVPCSQLSACRVWTEREQEFD